MNYTFKKLKNWVVAILVMAFGVLVFNIDSVSAAGYGLSMSPMKQSIIIDPGDSYKLSFRISNPSNSTQDTYYKIEIEPFYRDENGAVVYEAEGGHGEIVKWVSLGIPADGKLAPNDVKEVLMTINVPESASAGGQYFSVNVTAAAKPFDEEQSEEASDSATIKEIKRMSHLVYAEITGTVIKKGNILSADLPGFLLSGKITGSATVENLGNVHGEAKYVLKVFPLFSDEEIYTNEENPEEKTVLPNRTLYNETAWEGTPNIGIFNVVYTVEFEGSTAEVRKMVIKCPLWLLFLVLFAVAAIIIYFVTRTRTRRGTRRDEE